MAVQNNPVEGQRGAVLSARRVDDALCLTLAGDWHVNAALPSIQDVSHGLAQTPKPVAVRFEATELGRWDSGLVTRLIDIYRDAQAHAIPFDDSGLPEGARRLIALAFAVKAREGAARTQTTTPFVQKVGKSAQDLWRSTVDFVTFVGEATLSVGRFATGRAKYQKSDVMQHIEEAGANALPIVSLISVLIGMIFAFVGVSQLRAFGAGIYTANLVAVAMIREMAPIMTAIIMAGRTGAAYAAEIGTMKVNEEIDALTTLGINPMDFLVTPRMFALVLMIPALTMYASLMGIIGGAMVGLAMIDASFVQYAQQTISAVTLGDLFTGLLMCVVFGALVALSGCQQGIACGTSAMAVGQATTRAVVMGIVLIVVSASILTIIFINLGI
ncbi:MAG TPA: ABC transporter permease [Pseudomonadales bacterium]|jgi:phospholipid/cholesterol/gamma-HCH transport system permease protein|nr:ABC transporter permease [Pseudomonadales bacterium]